MAVVLIVVHHNHFLVILYSDMHLNQYCKSAQIQYLHYEAVLARFAVTL
jgi:hypothetical protein